jgi:heme/copper-type cytochrome/quinol oxidase subunit 2
LDSLPARALELVGVLDPLRANYLNGQIPDYQVRLIFAGTTIVIIFVLAFVVGMLVGSMRGYLERRALKKPSSRPPG